MPNSVPTTGVVLCLVASFAALAPAAAAANPRVDRALARLDLNTDGAISRDELASARLSRFDDMDRNDNGVLDAGDVATRPVLLARPIRVETLLASQDANRDDVVTRDELATGPTPAFDVADANGDGFLVGSEIEVFIATLAAR